MFFNDIHVELLSIAIPNSKCLTKRFILPKEYPLKLDSVGSDDSFPFNMVPFYEKPWLVLTWQLLHPWKLTWHWNISFFIGNTSSFMVDFPASHVIFGGHPTSEKLLGPGPGAFRWYHGERGGGSFEGTTEKIVSKRRGVSTKEDHLNLLVVPEKHRKVPFF